MILASINDDTERKRVDELVTFGPQQVRKRPAGWQDDRAAAENAVLALKARR